MGMKFGSFDDICEQAALVICPLVGSSQGIEPTCYSRNVQVGGTLIFQPAACFVHIVAIIMTLIMILHIRSKYTAVGRKEIVLFFYIYAVVELLAIFLDSAVIPTASTVYPWFTAAYAGLVAAAYMCLLINAFIGFQFAEDGTPLSLWGLRLACIVMFAVTFFVSIGTFKNKFGLSPTHPTVLWIIYLLWPLICVVVYIVLQLVLVIRTLDDRWPIGDIIFGTAFYAIAQVILFAFSNMICDAVKHYIDGLFLFQLCVLLSVMMVYKYWDSITKEDLEFSVGSKVAVWEVKDPLLAGYGNAGMGAGNNSGFPNSGSGAGSSQYGGYARGGLGADHYDDGSHYGGQFGGGGGKAGSLVGGISGGQLYGKQPHGYPPQGY